MYCPGSGWLSQGYGDVGEYLYLHQMRGLGPVVELEGVGGAMLLVHAELHRQVGAGAGANCNSALYQCTGFALTTR